MKIYPSRFLTLGLLACGAAAAQPAAEAPPASLKEMRELLQDPDGDLSRLAQDRLGKNGGNQLFYFPTRDEPSTPKAWGLKFENIKFESADGTQLHGWFIPAKSKKVRGTVVFSHGNSGSLGYHLGFIVWMAEAGFNVMMYDYRGFGKSGGVPDRRGMIDDVKAAFAYTSGRPDVDPDRLISFGHSLGGAKSITAIGEAPVKGLRAIIIDGAFSSYQGMARFVGGQLGASLVSDELAPKDFVAKVAPVPFLVVHGTADEVVPIAQGRELFEAAGEPKTLFEIKGGRHANALSRDDGAYRKKVIAWLDEILES